jgi:hypothetical protein
LCVQSMRPINLNKIIMELVLYWDYISLIYSNYITK